MLQLFFYVQSIPHHHKPIHGSWNFISIYYSFEDTEDLNFLWNKQYKDIREYDLKENMKKFILLYSNL